VSYQIYDGSNVESCFSGRRDEEEKEKKKDKETSTMNARILLQK